MTKAVLILTTALAFSGCFADQQVLDLTDAGIKARVEANLFAQPDLDMHFITVDVHVGIVTVSGLVSNWDDERLIEHIVKRTKGVEQAIFNIVPQD